GSAGMDVSTDNAIIIDSLLKLHKVPLKDHGPIGKGLSALLLGRSSATLQGIFVHPGVIDADYMGQICAFVSTPSPPVTIPAKTHIAQLIPFKSCALKTGSKLQGDGGFESMGEPQVYCTQVISDQRPNMVCTLTMPQTTPLHIKVSGMIATGADVTIIS
ncbi:POK9 protein, partial [Hylia prasina]|nr:POK9 protein [Hylia prasina]